MARRAPVWLALSELWLDTEQTDADIGAIAGTLAESGYDDAELRRIFLDELSPLVAGNFLAVAGVWSGFDEAWLLERATRRLEQLSRRPAWLRWLAGHGLSRRWMARVTAKDWQRLMAALPAARRVP